MATRKKAEPAQPVPAPHINKPWWKSVLVKVMAAIAAIAFLLTNIDSILSNARALPSEVQKTSDQFFNWYGDYAAWKGYWTNFPEGIVNLEEMNLSKDDFRLNIDESKDGYIIGTIETRGICEKVPYFDIFLIDGTISSSSKAEINIYDYLGGFRRDFARLRLKRDDYIMTAIPIADPDEMFPAEARIARASPDLIGSEDHEALCDAKKSEFILDSKKISEQAGFPPSRE